MKYDVIFWNYNGEPKSVLVVHSRLPWLNGNSHSLVSVSEFFEEGMRDSGPAVESIPGKEWWRI